MNISESDKKRFWARVNKNGPLPSHVHGIGFCWEWIGGNGPKGYGSFYVDKKSRRVHRVSWVINCGELSDEEHVLHKCDNRKCVNPNHLFLGDNLINARDREKKGRGADHRGELCGQAKLTAVEVLEIRSNQGRYSKLEIAKVYKISIPNVYHIIWGLSWKHIPLEAPASSFAGLQAKMKASGLKEGRRNFASLVRVWRFDDAPLKYQRLVEVPGAKWLAIVPERMGFVNWLNSEEFGLNNGEKFPLPNGEVVCVGYEKTKPTQ